MQVEAAPADWDKKRPAVVDTEEDPRFLLSRKATAAALVSDRRDVEATDEDDAPTDRNVAALKAVATRVAVSAKKAILASLWNCIVVRVSSKGNAMKNNAIYAESMNSPTPTHQQKNKDDEKIRGSSWLIAGCNLQQLSTRCRGRASR